MPYAIAPRAFEHNFVGRTGNDFFIGFDWDVFLFQQEADRAPNLLIVATVR